MKDKLKSSEVEKLKSQSLSAGKTEPFNSSTLQPFNQTEEVRHERKSEKKAQPACR